MSSTEKIIKSTQFNTMDLAERLQSAALHSVTVWHLCIKRGSSQKHECSRDHLKVRAKAAKAAKLECSTCKLQLVEIASLCVTAPSAGPSGFGVH